MRVMDRERERHEEGKVYREKDKQKERIERGTEGEKRDGQRDTEMETGIKKDEQRY